MTPPLHLTIDPPPLLFLLPRAGGPPYGRSPPRRQRERAQRERAPRKKERRVATTTPPPNTTTTSACASGQLLLPHACRVGVGGGGGWSSEAPELGLIEPIYFCTPLLTTRQRHPPSTHPPFTLHRAAPSFCFSPTPRPYTSGLPRRCTQPPPPTLSLSPSFSCAESLSARAARPTQKKIKKPCAFLGRGTQKNQKKPKS